MSILKTSYYDKPEGQDICGKMLATNAYAGTVGFAWSTLDVLMLSHPKGYLPTLARFAYNMGPLMGMASAFTLTTYMATNLRGKDDRINYFLGGLAAGSVAGAWKRNHITGVVLGFAFGIAGVLKKTSIIDGWEFFPPVVHREFMGVKKVDYTILAERPRNWTDGKE